MLIRRRFRALTSLTVALVVAGCGGVSRVPGAERVGLAPPAHEAQFANIAYAQWTDFEPAYRFYPGDEIEVSIPSAPELTKTVTVQPDGRITAPLIPPVMAADRTTQQLEATLSQAYGAHLLRPDVFVTAKAAPLKVFVGGEVGAPGVYDMQGDADALRAVIQAGGFSTTADRSKVIIIRRGADGQGMMRTADLLAGLRRPTTDLVPLRRFDIVYVPRSGVANAGLFVQQYFRDLSPIQFGFSYALNETGLN
ncbi:polysaccharide biosynthesis/export family protein [Phenylobacterium sp.]|uniref:polysaccharide biosynthesis/export family protein n=1 Tax=Phenylobacterium sp. TaxID=1871053 RepID=UPI002730C33D|nr:polysaccharide biosynthesis/export family protein [Phenylobacterium sp.]MDP1873989.1 polysaccharide biosynthesis/export family protein [Phenylobacterium sp.]MDP3488810.1 polysaccharide biosynthesis/export family protein [Phenylobacterium sp.]